MNEIIAELVKLTPFGIMDVDGHDVLIDAPPASVLPGQQINVFKKGKKVKNKRTGKVTDSEKQVAVLQVTTLNEEAVNCRLVSGEILPDDEAEEGSEYDKYIVRFADTSIGAVPALAQAVLVPQQAPVPVNKNVMPF